MNKALLCAALLAASSCAHAGIRLTDEEAEAVGLKIRHNESRGSIDGLTHWNKGEGWGLRQVLQGMPDEDRWLPGWRKRLLTYLEL